MRLLVWAIAVGTLAIHGGTTLPLIAGLVMVGCAESHGFARRRNQQLAGIRQADGRKVVDHVMS